MIRRYPRGVSLNSGSGFWAGRWPISSTKDIS